MFGYTTRDNGRDFTDEEILMRSRSEPWLFAVLLERYQDAFLRKAKTVLYNEQDAEEVVQDTFTKIYVHAAKFEPREGAKFSSWAYTILMNTAFTRYQKLVKEGKRTLHLDPEIWELQGTEANHSGFEEKKDAVTRILELLPEHFAYVLRLHYIERWSHKDIAKETGESVGTVKARVHRAKAAFRQKSKEQGAEASLL